MQTGSESGEQALKHNVKESTASSTGSSPLMANSSAPRALHKDEGSPATARRSPYAGSPRSPVHDRLRLTNVPSGDSSISGLVWPRTHVSRGPAKSPASTSHDLVPTMSLLSFPHGLRSWKPRSASGKVFAGARYSSLRSIRTTSSSEAIARDRLIVSMLTIMRCCSLVGSTQCLLPFANLPPISLSSL